MSLGIGNVEFELGGEPVVLKPTLRAAQTLSRQTGGLRAAIAKVGDLDIDAITAVIVLGLNRSGPKAAEEVAEKVWEAGITPVVEPVLRYLVNLANGGKPPAGGEEEADGSENPPKR